LPLRGVKLMLQRIQTIYLLLSGLSLVGLYLLFPIVTDTDGAIVVGKNEPMLLAVLIGSLVLTLVSILNFKKRQLQFVLNRLNIILNFVLQVVFVYRSLNISGGTLLSEKGIGVLIPIISIVFLVLANKATKRDEDLVKSVDRLR
jgi:hypothetical protein